MIQDNVRTFTGRSLQELSIEKVLSGELTAEDFRTSAATLRAQADAAESGGYRQLAENLRRAAELTGISNEEVLEIYNQLRPGRSNYKALIALAERLEKNTPDEMIIATNPTVEGEATSYYLQKMASTYKIRISRIAHGVPLGGELEYTDQSTLAHAFGSRRVMD